MNRFITLMLFVMLAVLPASTTAAERETIAIIGTGDMGNSLGPKLAEIGHPIIYGSREPDRKSVKALVGRTAR